MSPVCDCGTVLTNTAIKPAKYEKHVKKSYENGLKLLQKVPWREKELVRVVIAVEKGRKN